MSFSDIDGNGAVDTSNSEVLQVDHYYPFGMRMGGLSYNSGTENRYRYNGKEYHQELNLGLYDYGARMYNPAIGRWNGVDKLASLYDSWSPYNYVLGNPIRLIDPNGLFASDTLNVRQEDGRAEIFLGTQLITAKATKKTKENKKTAKSSGTGRVATTFFGPRPSRSRGSGRISSYEVQDIAQDPAMQGVMNISEGLLLGTLAVLPIGGTGFSAPGGIILRSGIRLGPYSTIGALPTARLLSEKAVLESAQGSTVIYRAVSKAELDDIAEFGLRTIEGGYETAKLFAPTLDEAAKFGKNNFVFDGIPNYLIRVQVPNNIMNSATRFTADGMNAISIPANKLHFLGANPLNFSPLIK